MKNLIKEWHRGSVARYAPTILLLLFFSVVSFAQAKDIYQFQTSEQQQQFTDLTKQLRCLVCQNETIADSNAALAKDLRNQVAVMIKKNQSDQQIINYLVNRYGDFVLYNPPVNSLTYGLWFGPVILLLIGILIATKIIWRRHKIFRKKS